MTVRHPAAFPVEVAYGKGADEKFTFACIPGSRVTQIKGCNFVRNRDRMVALDAQAGRPVDACFQAAGSRIPSQTHYKW